MNKTKIEWVRNPDGSQGYSWNPIKGLCKGGCSYCYARRYYQRFKLNPIVRFDTRELYEPAIHKKPAGIFVCSTHDLFGSWIDEIWQDRVISEIVGLRHHRFYILTKFPENILYNYIERFHSNIFFGVTITGAEREKEQEQRFEKLLETRLRIKFISFEPLLRPISPRVLDWISEGWIQWILVGAQTQPYISPLIHNIYAIINHCEISKTPIFLKNNLKHILGEKLIQNFPLIEENRPMFEVKKT